MMKPFGNHPTLNDNLIVYYPCNDNYADDNVRDACHNVDGTASVNTDTMNGTGKINGCFNESIETDSFTAVVEKVKGDIFQVGVPVSFNMWVYIDSYDGVSYQALIGNLNASLNGLQVMIDNTGATYGLWISYYGTGGTARIRSLASDIIIADWMMFTFIYDGNTVSPAAGMKYHINAIAPAPVVTSGLPVTMISQESSIIFGDSAYVGYKGLVGKQSDIGIWNRVLSQSEISALFNMSHGRARDPVKSNLFDNHPTLAESCLAEWGLEDDAANTDVAEVTGRFNGVLNVNSDVIATGGSDGIFGGSCMDLSLGSYIADIADIAPYIGWGKPFTIEAWVYNEGSYPRPFGNAYTGANLGMGIVLVSNKMYWTAADGTGNYRQMLNGTVIPAGSLAHIVLTYDGNSDPDGIATGSMGYVNGIAGASLSTVVGLHGDFANSIMYLGQNNAYSSARQSLTRFFTKELNQDEVTYLNNNMLGRRSL